MNPVAVIVMVDFSFLLSTTKVISEPLKMQMHFEMYSSFALASSPIPITVDDQLGIHVAPVPQTSGLIW